jgi:hypothetical protein
MAIKDLTGQTFGKLLILNRASKEEVQAAGISSNLYCAYWYCKCSCGNMTLFRGTSLSAGEYTQCSECAKKQRSNSALKHRVMYAGHTYNNLEIIEDLNEKDDKGNWLCLAKCTCGNLIKRPGVYIKNGNTKSCGCLKTLLLKQQAEKRRIDLVGKVFTYLTVLEYLGVTYKENYYYSSYKCECVCGSIVDVRTTYLTNGEVTSCGCKTPERLSLAQGGTGIPYEYKSLQEIIRGLPLMEQWKRSLLSASDYTCQISGIRGGTLNVHHIVPLNVVISKNNITKDNFMSFLPLLFDPNNGIVLSEDIHKQFHSIYGHDTDYYDLLEFTSVFIGVA